MFSSPLFQLRFVACSAVLAAAASPALADPMYHHTYDWGYASFTMGAGSHPKTEPAYKKPEPAYRCVLFLLVSCSFSVTSDDKKIS